MVFLEKIIVSVIIPAYNAQHTISESLNSVLRQTFKKLEVIVIDDGSTDETVKIVESYIALDSRVKLITQINAGVGSARNVGIQKSCGIYISPLDADDTWELNKLELQVNKMEETGNELGIVYCFSNRIDKLGNVIQKCSPYIEEGNSRAAAILFNYIGNASSPLFRTKILKKAGPYLERSEQGGFQGCEDWDMLIRVVEKANVAVVPFYLVNYRRHDGAMSSNFKDMVGSFEVMINRAKDRNPDLPFYVFKRSKGNFYRYIASKCYICCKFEKCVLYNAISISNNPLSILNYRAIKMSVISVIKWLFQVAENKTRQRSLTGLGNFRIFSSVRKYNKL